MDAEIHASLRGSNMLDYVRAKTNHGQTALRLALSFLQIFCSRDRWPTQVFQHMLDDFLVKVIAAQVIIAVAREYLRHALFQAYHGDIKGSTPEVINQDGRCVPTAGPRPALCVPAPVAPF